MDSFPRGYFFTLPKMKSALKTYRVFHRTSFGIGFELRKARDKKSLREKLPARLASTLIRIEKV